MFVFCRGLRSGIRLFDSRKILFSFWLFLLVFPKGGIKIGDVPLTWGYLLTGLVSLLALFRKRWVIQSSRLEALVCLFPFQLVVLSTFLVNGFTSTGWMISFVTSFFFLPYIFLLVLSESIENMDLSLFLRLFRSGVAFVSYYGIALFIYKQIVGEYFEVPFLTVNWGDYGVSGNLKCNSRGVVSKLISTYSNGQIFGISMILLLPLYEYVQKNFWHKLATKIALILTFSRTTWIGFLVCEIVYNLVVTPDKKKGLLKLFAMFFFLAGGIGTILFVYGFNITFLFDTKLGGRDGQFNVFQNFTFFAEEPFFCIPEMTYLGILSSFGLIGLITYLIAMIGPILFYGSIRVSKLRFCLLLGLANYLFVAISDGAVHYIPVLAFYWILVSLLARKSLEVEEILVPTS